jgi:thioredoxin reductase (NADPH)
MDFSIQEKEKDSGRKHFSAAVIGSGPAGSTAAIYLGRSKVDTVVFEKVIPGGYVVNVEKIENYPGFVEGIRGEELGKLYAKHAEKFGAEIKCEEVTKLELNEMPFRIQTSQGSYTSDSIILATGTSNRKLGVPGEKEFTHKGISFCATCDAPFFEGEDIIVVGAGNSGAQESLYLSRFAKHITIVELLDYSTAEPILVDRLKANDKIELLVSHSVESFKGDKLLSSVDIKDIKSGEVKNLKVKGAFIYAGEIPNNDLFKDMVKLNDKGFIVTDECMRTSVKGVFAAGDVRNTPLRQVATSIGDGAIAGHEAYRFLEEIK